MRKESLAFLEHLVNAPSPSGLEVAEVEHLDGGVHVAKGNAGEAGAARA